MPDVAYGVAGLLCCGGFFVFVVFVMAAVIHESMFTPDYPEDLGLFDD